MKPRDFFGLFLLASGWGPTFLLTKIGVETISPLTLTSMRVFTASIFMLAYCMATRRSFKPVLPVWKNLLLMAIIGNAIPFTFCSWAETMVQSSTAGVIEGSVPIITAVMTYFFTPHRKLPKDQIFGIAMGFLGILIIFAPDILQMRSGSEDIFLGKVLLVIMSISFAGSFVFSKEKLEHLPHIPAVALQLVMASVVMIPLTLMLEGAQAFSSFTHSSFWTAVTLGVYGTAFPWCVYFYLIKHGSAAQVSLAIYLLPIVAIVLGWVVLDESLRWNLAAGTAVILFSLLLAGGALSKRKVHEYDNPTLKS